MNTLRLITIPISHYCEKARWALERLDLPYHEERHLQGFHYPRTWWCSRGLTVPVLLDGATVIGDSTAILRHLDRYAPPGRRLYPEDAAERRKVDELEDLFDEVLGVESRRWFYFHYAGDARAALRLAGQGIPRPEQILGQLCFPLMRRFAVRRLRVTEARVTTGLARCRELVHEVDKMLADGRPYLLGERFTAADLAFACMIAPFVLPPQYGVRLPHARTLPEAMRPTALAFRATAAGRFALRLFATERHETADRISPRRHAQ